MTRVPWFPHTHTHTHVNIGFGQRLSESHAAAGAVRITKQHRPLLAAHHRYRITKQVRERMTVCCSGGTNTMGKRHADRSASHHGRFFGGGLPGRLFGRPWSSVCRDGMQCVIKRRMITITANMTVVTTTSPNNDSGVVISCPGWRMLRVVFSC